MLPSRLNRVALFLSCICIAVIETGCGPSGPVNEKVTPENVKKIQLEMKLADVEAILGPGKATTAPQNSAPEDKSLAWKRWKHSDRGLEINVGFDKGNTAAALDKPVLK